MARFPDFRRCLLPAPSRSRSGASSGMRRVSYRLQLPGRSGFSPLSLHPFGDKFRRAKKNPDPHERIGENRQKFTLHVLPSETLLCEAISDRSSGLRVILLAAPSRPRWPVAVAAFVSDHSGGAATDSHRLPWLFPLRKHPLPNISTLILVFPARNVKSYP